jgi:hypothetical protein
VGEQAGRLSGSRVRDSQLTHITQEIRDPHLRVLVAPFRLAVHEAHREVVRCQPGTTPAHPHVNSNEGNIAMRRTIQRLITRGLVGLLAPILMFIGGEAEIANQMIAPLRLDRPGEKWLLERHVAQIVCALRAVGKQTSLANLLRHMCPEQLLDLSYDLDRDAGVNLRSYLADLPESASPVFAAARKVLRGSLRAHLRTCWLRRLNRPVA